MKIAHNVMLSAKQSLLDISAIFKHSCQNRAYYKQEYITLAIIINRLNDGNNYVYS